MKENKNSETIQDPSSEETTDLKTTISSIELEPGDLLKTDHNFIKFTPDNSEINEQEIERLRLLISHPEYNEPTGKKAEDIEKLSSLQILKSLRKLGRGLDTSQGFMYQEDIWGRDRVITAIDTLSTEPEIALETIKTLAEIQGTKVNKKSEEEPGRIHDENKNIDRWPAPPLVKLPFRTIISPLWGGNSKEYTMYFSGDTTPLYISLVHEYFEKVDSNILDQEIIDKDGKQKNVGESVKQAVGWISSHLNNDGLVEIPKTNIFSILFQTWRDGIYSNPDEKGRLPNILEPIVYLDIQALSAQAYNHAAEMVSNNNEESDLLREKAKRLIDVTVKEMWMEDEQFFSIGFDKDEKGNNRLLRTIQSNAGWLLNTDFFDELSEGERKKYISGIITKLFSDEFLTDVGIRTRSVRHADDRSTADYHGSLVSWPVDTYMFAKGLRRQGFPDLATQLENRIINAVNMAGKTEEFFIIDKNGKVIIDVEEATKKDNTEDIIAIERIPEKNIAWTTTAVAASKRQKGKEFRQPKKEIESDQWKIDLQSEILKNIKQIDVYKSREEVAKNFFEQPNTKVDPLKGMLNSIKDLTSQMSRELFPNKLRKILREKFKK